MATNIPELEETKSLGLVDEIIIHQENTDKRLSLDLGNTLSWARRQGYNYLGAHSTGISFPDTSSFTSYEGRVYFVKGNATLPYIAQGNDPSIELSLYVKKEEKGIYDWNPLDYYPQFEKVKHQGEYYTAKVGNENVTPDVGGNSTWLQDVSNKRFATNSEAIAGAEADLVMSALATLESIRNNAVPVGTVCSGLYLVPPEGWLELKGQTLDPVKYPLLTARTQELFGTDTLPDARGEFIRGFDNGRGVDTGRVAGSFQSDELKSHVHPYTKFKEYSSSSGNSFGWAISETFTEQVNTSPAGGAETRPRNLALMTIIKADPQ